MSNLSIPIAALPYRAAVVDRCFSAVYSQSGGHDVITASQMRAARELLGIDQKTLADRAGVSLSAIQRMEAGDSDLRAAIDIQKKVIGAFRTAGVEIIGDHERSDGGGRGVRLVHPVGSTGRTH